jgi:hypothetical protein
MRRRGEDEFRDFLTKFFLRGKLLLEEIGRESASS